MGLFKCKGKLINFTFKKFYKNRFFVKSSLNFAENIFKIMIILNQ